MCTCDIGRQRLQGNVTALSDEPQQEQHAPHGAIQCGQSCGFYCYSHRDRKDNKDLSFKWLLTPWSCEHSPGAGQIFFSDP